EETEKEKGTNKARNTAEESSTTEVVKTEPEATKVDAVTSETKGITETGKAGRDVTETYPNGTTATGTGNEEGRYEVKVQEIVVLKGGETIQVTTTDEAGNTSEETTTTVEDKSATEVPTVDPMTSETKAITGTGAAGSKETVTFPDGSTSEGIAN
ncbi:Ig-like domain-containing protein, partial [Staphylococcus felis]|uniref:Ig-like domain-containing protein n=1 Tax=Staphylococcus felis TaxID=46127 RepID=UPI000E381C3B